MGLLLSRLYFSRAFLIYASMTGKKFSHHFASEAHAYSVVFEELVEHLNRKCLMFSMPR